MQQKINPNGNYLTVSQLSKIIKISNASILAAIKNGEINGAIQIGASYRVDISQPLSNIGKDEPKADVSNTEKKQEKEAVEVEPCMPQSI